MAADAPDRNLRFVVGHLMHYESLRLRIVEIESSEAMSGQATSVRFKGTGDNSSLNNPSMQKRPSTGDLRRKSPPPPQVPPVQDDDEEGDEDMEDDDSTEDELEELTLQRYPSGSARPPPLAPSDGSSSDDEDEAISPSEPSPETLEAALQYEADPTLKHMYEDVRKCHCHGHSQAPQIERMWMLPDSEKAGKGVKRAVAELTSYAKSMAPDPGGFVPLGMDV
ncbi:MAG: hypothetical protein M1820_006766 [Bogoriella megaspora]|nr:MAG: hypothetical protein M1820_006766 [Bogoriella megaspora]